MGQYLEFKPSSCKNCYRCLRECPVKAIKVVDQKAVIMEDLCILCGKCTFVCHQNAKYVHGELEEVKRLLKKHKKVYVSVAPSFVSSFGIENFEVMRVALKRLGFFDAEETAVGAAAVTEKYEELLKSGRYRNLISSACPAVNRLIEIYRPKALPFLAPVDTPMVAHAKIIKKRDKDAVVLFVGPCIAKKREARESDLIENVLTFEELEMFFKSEGIDLKQIEAELKEDATSCGGGLAARNYPISRGLIKSFKDARGDYEYIAVSGVANVMQALESVDELYNVFLELNACDHACINGPCAVKRAGGVVRANIAVRNYAHKGDGEIKPDTEGIDLSSNHYALNNANLFVPEREIKAILAKTGKFRPEDELDCGACGYDTCRQKAWAVANGFADVEMCLPYVRERAESMSNEVIMNSPNGIVVIDYDLKIQDINRKGMELWGIDDSCKGNNLVDYFNPTDFILAISENRNLVRKKVKVDKTGKYAEMHIVLLPKHKVMFAIMKDITERVSYDSKLNSVKLETLQTTDDVIKKQMRVAQEIASLLGETTAETKVALLKLKKTLSQDDKED